MGSFDRIHPVFMTLAAVAATWAVLLMALTAVSAVDMHMNDPERAAREHILGNIDGIREMAERTMDDGVAVREEAVIDCWEENDPGVVPSGG